MSGNHQEENFDWLVQVDYGEPEEGKDGPPASWPYPSWFNRKTGEWYYSGKPDPCPVKALGLVGKVYVFVTGARVVREFTSSELHGSGGPNDLFGGELGWALRHFRKYDLEAKSFTGGLQKQSLMGAMIRACRREGYYNNASPQRSVGTWRGPDGGPVIHAGDVILYDGEIYEPGDMIGGHRYVLGRRCELPALEWVGNKGYRLKPGTLADCHNIVARVCEWNWLNPEGRDLFVGGLYCDMLGDALHWKPHRFIRAMPGAGKSMLLRLMEALLSSAAHAPLRDFTRASLEQMYSNTAAAFLLDEMESDTDGMKMRRVLELIRLMSDEGAVGARGTPSGQHRNVNLHGSVTMVATLTEAWRPQDRRRITCIELGRISEGKGYIERSREQMDAVFEEVAAMAPKVRARAIDRFDLFRENLTKARRRVLELGGSPGDSDQLGYLIAGWATMTSDKPLSDDEVRGLERFAPYIMTLTEEAEGTDDPSDCLNTLFGLPSGIMNHGRELTVGQVIAKARDSEAGASMRDALPGLGLRLQRQKSEVTGRIETWPEAWLAIGNKVSNLEKLFADYPQYQTPKRAQILQGLKRMVNGVPHVSVASAYPIYFGGATARAWLVPPVFLPDMAYEREDVDPPPADL